MKEINTHSTKDLHYGFEYLLQQFSDLQILWDGKAMIVYSFLFISLNSVNEGILFS